MPDLSKMLGDVYGAPTDEEERIEYRPASPEGRPVPEWADDNHLDRAFAGWTPGPDADAPAAERKMFAQSGDAPAPLADDLAAALSEAVLAEQYAPERETDQPLNVPPLAVTPTAFGRLTADAPVTPAPAPAPAPVALPEPAPVLTAVAAPAVESDVEPEPTLPTTPSAPSWNRSHDDILPAGGGKKLSLSLRRR